MHLFGSKSYSTILWAYVLPEFMMQCALKCLQNNVFHFAHWSLLQAGNGPMAAVVSGKALVLGCGRGVGGMKQREEVYVMARKI